MKRATLAGVAALVSCGARPAGDPGLAMVATEDDSPVVATVDGAAIRASAVKRQAEAAGTGAREALQALIDTELVAAVARARGLSAERSVQEATREALVRRYVAGTFEREVTRAMVGEPELRAAYERNRLHYDRPDAVSVEHILAPSAPGDPPEREAQLRAKASEVAARARGVKTVAEFEAVARVLSDGQVTLRLEALTTPREGVVEEPFAAAAFALRKPGDVSGVVATRFGFHVIYLVERLPAIHRTFEEASEELREGLWPQVRKREFGRWMDAQMGRHRLAVFSERLEEKRE